MGSQGKERRLSRVTRELAFEIMQQRKQAYWEFWALFVTAWGVEENLFANRLL
jgi:hypothetical protein